MKRIGLIGGLSPESTVHYYQILCREHNREFGGLNFSGNQSREFEPATTRHAVREK
jgi:aspartate/glutamate racemase